jgi:hypothetical protein
VELCNLNLIDCFCNTKLGPGSGPPTLKIYHFNVLLTIMDKNRKIKW